MVVSRGTALPYPPPPGLAGDSDDDTGAVTITAAELATATGADADTAERLLPVARRVVLDYAPAAPTELLNEAVVRFAGYLAGDFGAVRSEGIGELSVEYAMNHAAAFRNCGAAGLLTRYKVRRGGSIG